MSNNRLVFEGLAELRAALRALPADLAAEAGGIVLDAAADAASEVKADYPERTGNLRRHVSVARTSGAGPFGAEATVKNTAKHAALFEHGTQARHTALGANRGAMPPGHVFIPAMVRRRRQMYDRLKALMTRHGLSVSGSA